MNKMASAFNTTIPALENELMQLILDGLINARIDSQGKVTSSCVNIWKARKNKIVFIAILMVLLLLTINCKNIGKVLIAI